MVPQFELLQLLCDFWQQNSQYVRLYLAVIRHLVVETVTHSGTECGTLTSWIRPQCATAAPGSMRDLTWTDSLSVFQSIQWNMLTTSAWLCTHFTRACSSASRTGACAQDGCLCSLFSVICIKLTYVLFSLKMKSTDTHLSNPSQQAACHEITWLLYSVLSLHVSVLVLMSRTVYVMVCF